MQKVGKSNDRNFIQYDTMSYFYSLFHQKKYEKAKKTPVRFCYQKRMYRRFNDGKYL